MEPITLCGAVILAVGLWVEFEPTIRTTHIHNNSPVFYAAAGARRRTFKRNVLTAWLMTRL